MRFIWINPPKDKDRLRSKPKAGTAGAIEIHTDPKEQENDLKRFFEAQIPANLNEKQKKALEYFNNNLDAWDLNGDVAAIRTGGRTKKQNEKNYMTKHALLSSAFLNRVPGVGMEFEINFKGNETAYWKVGLGDLLPPEVRKVEVTKTNGQVMVAERGIDPSSKRVGYYENGNYVPVYTGDKVEILETVTIPKGGNQKTFAEHIAIYQGGGSTAEVGQEALFNTKTREVYSSVPEAKRSGIKDDSRKLREKLMPKGKPLKRPRRSPGTPWNVHEINGKKYQKLTQDYIKRNIANNAAAMAKWVSKTDPLTGRPFTFMGQRIKGGGLAYFAMPYFKEAERRIKAAGLGYKLYDVQGQVWRPIKNRGKFIKGTLSNHSFGTATDINVRDNMQGPSWEQLNPKKRVPMSFVKIMEDCGFKWGGNFRTPDAMHFELAVNPFTSTDILRSEESRRYMKYAEDMSGHVGSTTRERWEVAKSRSQRRGSARVSTARTDARRPAERRPTAPIEGIANRNTKDVRKISQDHEKNSEHLVLDDSPRYRGQINTFKRIALANRDRYKRVEAKTGVPWELIAAIHYREGSFNFSTYLHNGQKLGKRTTVVPKGKLFYDWETAAIDAINMNRGVSRRVGIRANTKNLGPLLAFAETYNGLGYRFKGRTSPYVYAGTNIYRGGMYVKDGKYVASKYDGRIGVAAGILALQNS